MYADTTVNRRRRGDLFDTTASIFFCVLGSVAIGQTALTKAVEDQQMASVAFLLPVEGQMPSLVKSGDWLNSQPVTSADLRGKVVLLEFWAYSCINWRRQLPYVRA